MDKLWAPWRIKYIAQKKQKGCVFCRLEKSRQDAKNLVLWRGKYCFVMLNVFPYNNGHLMVISRRHAASMEDLTDNEMLDINKAARKSLAMLRKVLKPHGFNIGINMGRLAGAGVDKHFHLHIVPRWDGDTNFMPVVSATKIISQSLNELYKALKKGSTHAKI